MAVALGRLIPATALNYQRNQPRWRPGVVSANMRRHRRHRQRPLNLPNLYNSDSDDEEEEEEEEIRGVGRAVLTALDSDPPPQLPSPKKAIGEAVALRGSDVLMALQRAAVRKERRRRRGSVGGGGGGSGGGGGGGAAAESGEVRPVNVRREWGARLEELERRLQEFLV